jgi:site-specific recombinase XerD
MFRLFLSGRTGRYYCEYSIKNHRRQFSCKTANKKKALKFASERITLLLEEGERSSGSRQLLSRFTEHYLQVIKEHISPNTVTCYRDSLCQLKKVLGDVEIGLITEYDCQKFLYCSQPSTQTASKHFRQLKRAFSLAQRWKFISMNPFDSLDPIRPVQRKKGYFKQKEFGKFYETLQTKTFAQRRFKRIVLLARLTGCRLSEIRFLRKDNIDFKRKCLYITNFENFRTKSGKNRKVPLSNNAIELLHQQISENIMNEENLVKTSEFVFPNQKGNQLSKYTISALFIMHRKKIFPDRRDLCFHSLRSSFITHLYFDGVKPQTIQICCGHRTIATTESYAHLEMMPLDGIQESLNQLPEYDVRYWN